MLTPNPGCLPLGGLWKGLFHISAGNTDDIMMLKSFRGLYVYVACMLYNSPMLWFADNRTCLRALIELEQIQGDEKALNLYFNSTIDSSRRIIV